MRSLDSLVALVEEELLSSHNVDDEKTLRLYLRAISELRDTVAVYGTLGHRREAFERLLGHAWLVDAELHERFHAQWRSFVDELKATLSAMTLNERLCEIGLLEEFEDAIRRAHRSDVARCLRAVFLDDANINAILENQGLPTDRTMTGSECPCQSRSPSSWVRPSPTEFTAPWDLIERSEARWNALFRCRTCGAYWVVEHGAEYNRDTNVAMRVETAEHWDLADLTDARRQLLVDADGESSRPCRWSGCPRRALRNRDVCVDHAYGLPQQPPESE